MTPRSFRDMLERDEGVRFRIYDDKTGAAPSLASGGKITAGIGRNMSDVPFTQDEVDLMFANDENRLTTALAQYAWFVALDDVRQQAIKNVGFNLGVSGLLHFPHMIVCLAAKDWAGARVNLLDSEVARDPATAARYARIGAMLETGEWA